MDYNDTVKRLEVEAKEKWREAIEQIPTLNFKEEWNVKIIPPFGGAIARFFILDKEEEQVCSVFLDFYDRLGMYGEPYYELYPYEDSIKRYSLKETEELLYDIDTIWKEAHND